MENSAPILELRNLSKSFPGVRALSNVSFDLKAGEVHALVGENGAGKSTLLSCMNGLQQPNEGEILIDGRQVTLATPSVAIEHHLAMVHQELVLCSNLTVAQNMFLGREPRGGLGTIDRATMNRKASKLLETIGVRIDPNRKVGTLSLNEQQIVEICRALATEPKVIVLDEPTASLNDDQVAHLLGIVKMLKSRGLGIVYVSHRLTEVLEISDRITVLRDGRVVTVLPAAGLTEPVLVSHMVGKAKANAHSVYRPRRQGEVLLKVDGLSKAGKFKDVSFELRKGEILGVAGLLGCNREIVAQALFGATETDGGRIVIGNAAVKLKTPHDAIRLGVAYMPADRKNEGLVLGMNVADNASMTTLRSVGKWGVLRRGQVRRLASDLVRLLSIKVSGLSQKASQLSGGNQQKIVIGKWIARKSGIVIAEDPTRGVDIGAKAEIWDALQTLAEEGKALILLTTELQEMLHVCDRIIVMSRGRITGEFQRSEFSAEAITQRFFA
ncbi:sugar ABC transporter ATP-binding protein [Sinorhizobium mexicanum]|uniref:Sugar ABC transporter ATP-binding protein n=1 Tax=Sinorhizobium mexicanum TaxID=375549 RepID=A0A859QLF3_9HYPH|nr:sugar ABC transporter ATP-binding protein [Sinorhizobium mexicanum]MBP1886697.1 ABC-type sugar transport system ATPase subunit [Sinorhizobium mexicanum]QLL65914.1 sugar ABC transporter ATP-binding protein [Sinorhizobium mexicanum]